MKIWSQIQKKKIGRKTECSGRTVFLSERYNLIVVKGDIQKKTVDLKRNMSNRISWQQNFHKPIEHNQEKILLTEEKMKPMDIDLKTKVMETSGAKAKGSINRILFMMNSKKMKQKNEQKNESNTFFISDVKDNME